MQFEKHLKYYRGLMDALLASGDGYTERAGYVVIDISEEYELLNMWGLQMQEQQLLHNGSQQYDLLKVGTKGSQETSEIYFNITLMMKKKTESLLR